MAQNPRNEGSFYLRMPLQLRESLSSIASDEGRSMNSIIVEILAEKIHTLQVIGAAAENDLMATAYYSAESAEIYLQAVRGAILRFKKLEGGTSTSPGKNIPEPALPMLGEPINQLTPLQRELAAEVSNLSETEQAALLTIMRKPKKRSQE